ncbi:MAG: hypothetical protein ABIJ17_00645, partial [Patescibacteria group bacterium]
GSNPTSSVLKKMKNKYLKKILFCLIIIFIFLLLYLFVPFSISIRRILFPFFAIFGLLFLLFGIILLVFSKKEKGKLKTFLILTGISAISPLLFTVLHNLFYGLSITFENYKALFEWFHALFFIISIIISPIIFIIGIIGSMILLKNKH